MEIDDPIIKDKTPDAEYSTSNDQKWIVHIVSYNHQSIGNTPSGIVHGFFVHIHEVNIASLAKGLVTRNLWVEITQEKENSTKFETKDEADEIVNHLKHLQDESDRILANVVSLQSIPY